LVSIIERIVTLEKKFVTLAAAVGNFKMPVDIGGNQVDDGKIRELDHRLTAVEQELQNLRN
jgi:hypothetical protein